LPGRDLNRWRKLDSSSLYGPDFVRNFCAAEPRNCTSESRRSAQSQIVAQLMSTARHGHEVRYRRTEIGSALLHARRW